MNGTTPDCIYIGGHIPGFDSECYWCVNAKRNAYGTALFMKEHKSPQQDKRRN